ncbi:MAG: ABC transporter, permease protein 2 (cluster 1, maltose/g3p/polyamine/iron), partial [uncultured Chloroflexia bacterium]
MATLTTSTRRRTAPLRSLTHLLLYVILIIGAIAMLLPFFWMVSASLKTLREVLQIPPTWLPNQVTLRNYAEVFRQQPLFGRFFLNSVIAATITVISVLITSALAGYAFAKFEFPGKRLFFVFILSTMMIPFQIRMVPLYVM